MKKQEKQQDTSNIRFAYLPSLSDDGRVLVIARRFDKETGVIQYGISIKGPEDQNKKSFGKMIAQGRLLKTKTCRTILSNGGNILGQILFDLHKNPLKRMVYLENIVKDYYESYKLQDMNNTEPNDKFY